MFSKLMQKWKNWRTKIKAKTLGSVFLCDSCKWNYGNVCTRPERPNARECPEYTAK